MDTKIEIPTDLFTLSFLTPLVGSIQMLRNNDMPNEIVIEDEVLLLPRFSVCSQ